VLPDNVNQGTLERCPPGLCEWCIQIFAHRRRTIWAGIDRTILTGPDLTGLRNRAGENKSVDFMHLQRLEAGKTIQLVQDNRWLEGPTLTLPRVAAVSNFLRQLFTLP